VRTRARPPQAFQPGIPAALAIHGAILTLGLLTWQSAPKIQPEDVIPVEMVSDTPSAIGPDTAAETLKTGTKTEEEQVSDNPLPENVQAEAILPSPEPQPAPQAKPAAAPPPPPPLPAPKIPTPPPPPAATKPIQPGPSAVARRQPSPAPPPPQTRARAPDTRPAPPPPPLFDIAAATTAASGADSGGRRTPKLGASGQAARQGAAGGGTMLAGDLESALRSQVINCWLEPANMSNPGRLVVVVRIELAQDGRLSREPALVSPSSRAGADPTLLVAIDSALRAVRQCAPYTLPAERYETWRQVNFAFDPSKMRRR
jgi:outer membrane biosynthesis protein TonB